MTTQFSQKHYIAIAKVLDTQIGALRLKADNARYAAQVTRYGDQLAAVQVVAASLARLFKADNPKFDEDRFLKAAGVR